MAMNVETVLFKLDGNPYFSPEFSRGGLRAIFNIQSTHIGNSGTLTVTAQTRNSSASSWTDLVSSSAISTVTFTPLTAPGLEELVRLKFVVGGPGATSAVGFIIPPPTWFPD
jgi:hypothetical protein